MDRPHVLGDAAPGERHSPSGRVRRAQRPHGPARTRLRRARPDALLPHGAWPPRGAPGAPLRRGRRARAEHEDHLDLAQPAAAAPRPALARQLPERDRPVALLVQPATWRLFGLRRQDGPREGLPPRDRRREVGRPAAQDRRKMP